MEDVIVNKVAESGLVTIDLANYYPQGETVLFDLKSHLFMGLILKEKDFREALKNTDWSIYKDKNVAITCSVDAIIPMWAYMLVATYLQPIAKDMVFGNEEALLRSLFVRSLDALPVEEFRDKKVMIKGCGKKAIPEAAYIEITRMLAPLVKSIMYGEACSTVPIFKSKMRMAEKHSNQ